ncbi:hypothetical protein BKA66DRAFT_472275 [Pyrenochaeta sp. MPI-SDFR-AT-0127]|nr:hypothetical protein BKA66DRAFT_472275 [Pyrenochaeta sp. MPI-SDFR-AT-0127]
MNYIPNLSAAEPIPALRKSTFPEDHPHTPRRGDELVNVGFLPSLYQDGRHGIGYFTFHMGRTPMESRWRICLFTPCSNKDLEHFSMIENLQPGETGGGPMNWKSIAVRSGRWANKNDGFGINWSVGFITAVYLWKKRLGITMGVKEWVPTAT